MQRDVAHGGGKAAGRSFLEENKDKEGVITLASGLQYKVLVEGGGVEHPLVSTPCECHYAGKLLDGTEFDSSYKRGTPTTFAPNQVIKGWTEAMQLMVQGDKWEMYIPYELAYGAAGKPPKIPACAMLIFVMEIVKIKGETKPRTAPYPEWTTEELALWLEKDEAAVQKWRDSKLQKWLDGDEKLKASYPSREELDEWLDSTGASSKNKSLWKRTRAAKKKSGAAAEAPPEPATEAPPKPAAEASPKPAAALTQEMARKLLTTAINTFLVPANKERLSSIVAECDAGPPESAGMMKMMKLMPVIQELLTTPLQEYGFGSNDLMSVMMQIKSFETVDPSIAADTDKLMKAVQGDLSGFA